MPKPYRNENDITKAENFEKSLKFCHKFLE